MINRVKLQHILEYAKQQRHIGLHCKVPPEDMVEIVEAAMLQGAEQTNYRAIVERIAEIVHGKVTDIDLLTVTIKSMKDNLHGRAEPVTTAYKLPANVIDALKKALQAMSFMGDTLNEMDAVCEEDVEYVTPAFEAVRKVLDGNSPVIPDGYALVPVEPTAEMQSAAAGAIRFDTTPINKLWTGNAVYRAMLAAAPQQEVKP